MALKDVKQAEVVFDSEPARPGNPTQRQPRDEHVEDTNDDQDDATSSKTETLSYDDKKEIEKGGLDVATRKLEEIGYVVQRMPDSNPGYDLRATKEKETLRVEVKAHLKTAAKIDLSIREWEECVRWKNSSDGNRWELWNVENLSADSAAPIKISRCTEIPEEAIETSMMRVDVRRCVRKQV